LANPRPVSADGADRRVCSRFDSCLAHTAGRTRARASGNTYVAFTVVQKPAPEPSSAARLSPHSKLGTLDGRSGCCPERGSTPRLLSDPSRQLGIKMSYQGSNGIFLLLWCHGNDNDC
jgi:hypothetical protein